MERETRCLSHEELTENIYRSLFELADSRNSEVIESECREKVVPVDNVVFEKGDEWITRKGRYIFQERKFLPSLKPFQVIFIPKVKMQVRFLPYTFNKMATLSGKSAWDISSDLAREVRAFLLPQIIAEETQDSISKRDSLGIGRRRKDVKRFVKKTYKAIGLNSRGNKKELIQRLAKVFKNNTKGIDSTRMMLFYVAIVLMVSEVETGTVDTITARLQGSFRELQL